MTSMKAEVASQNTFKAFPDVSFSPISHEADENEDDEVLELPSKTRRISEYIKTVSCLPQSEEVSRSSSQQSNSLQSTTPLGSESSIDTFPISYEPQRSCIRGKALGRNVNATHLQHFNVLLDSSVRARLDKLIKIFKTLVKTNINEYWPPMQATINGNFSSLAQISQYLEHLLEALLRIISAKRQELDYELTRLSVVGNANFVQLLAHVAETSSFKSDLVLLASTIANVTTLIHVLNVHVTLLLTSSWTIYRDHIFKILTLLNHASIILRKFTKEVNRITYGLVAYC